MPSKKASMKRVNAILELRKSFFFDDSHGKSIVCPLQFRKVKAKMTHEGVSPPSPNVASLGCSCNQFASFIRFYEKGMVTLLAYWQKGWWQLHIQINREGKEGGIHLP